MKTWNFPTRKTVRREEAVQRQEEWNALSVEEKLTRLEGRGYGSSKEVEKLKKAIQV